MAQYKFWATSRGGDYFLFYGLNLGVIGCFSSVEDYKIFLKKWKIGTIEIRWIEKFSKIFVDYDAILPKYVNCAVDSLYLWESEAHCHISKRDRLREDAIRFTKSDFD